MKKFKAEGKFSDLLRQIDPTPVTSGAVVKIKRGLLGWTLKELEEVTGIFEANLSAIENDRMPLTTKTACIFAAAFGSHPIRFLFPEGEENWEKTKEILEIEKKGKALIARKKRGA